ncbi:MAG: tetratricopeptide repeat protein [Candidatus Eisenbacteria bacterium]|nr:tetratricopeptide repeat protein [Candidatus Eisenbacteria bacterium]
MGSGHVIFVSAVSGEFHRSPEGQEPPFHSYRDALARAFRVLAPHFEVVLQEDLVVGTGDLLETLDLEISRALVLIHLVGDQAGWAPVASEVRRLHGRHPGFLADYPELRDAVGASEAIPYTQWEYYLALHHGVHRLIFDAQPGAPRSPEFAPGDADAALQDAHRKRIQISGGHRAPFHDQADVARKAIRSFLHFRIDPSVDPDEPSEGALSAAWEGQAEIVRQLAEAIRRPDPRLTPVRDPANTAAFVAAVRSAAERWLVNQAAIVSIAARHEEEMRAAADHRPTPKALYEQALAELALGDYRAARFTGRRAANLALELRESDAVDAGTHRKRAQNALLLVHESAKAAHDIPGALAALEEAAGLVDRQTEPILWAEVHESLAGFLLDHGRLKEADELVSEVIDLREEHQGESHPALASALILWCRLLRARGHLSSWFATWEHRTEVEAIYAGMESVARRAQRIAEAQNPPDREGLVAALGHRAVAMEGRALVEAVSGKDNIETAKALWAEAETLLRETLDLAIAIYPPDHPRIAWLLETLVSVLVRTSQPKKAEPISRRVLEIKERVYGPESVETGLAMANLGTVLMAQRRDSETDEKPDLEEAERLLGAAVRIYRASFRITGRRPRDMAAAVQQYAKVRTRRGAKVEQIRAVMAELYEEERSGRAESTPAGAKGREDPGRGENRPQGGHE